MDRLFGVLLILAMSICITSFNIFFESNQWLFVGLAIFGIALSSFMFITNNLKYLRKSKK